MDHTPSKALALIWYRALTWYSSPARPFAAPEDPLLVTGQQGSPVPACRQLSRARNACAGSSSEESTKLKHGTKLGPTLCYWVFTRYMFFTSTLFCGSQPSFMTLPPPPGENYCTNIAQYTTPHRPPCVCVHTPYNIDYGNIV